MSPRRPRLEVLTPRGPGGIAVLAARGPERYQEVAPLLRSRDGRPIVLPRPGRVRPWLCTLVCDGEELDRILVVDRPEAELIELHLHGSEAILAELRNAAELVSPAPAGPADELLRRALCPEQLGLALEQREIDFPGWLVAISHLAPAERTAELGAARTRSRIARALAEPRRVVLVGARNAGKSTLLNRLTFAERALAGDLPGLTRDPVAETTVLDGYPYVIVDTAGEGEAADDLERRAVELGRRERGGALCVLVADGHRAFSPIDRELSELACLVVRTKNDLPASADWPAIRTPVVAVSCLYPRAASAVRSRIGRALREARGLPPAPRDGVGGPAALNDEQQSALDAVGLGRLESDFR